MLVVGGGERLLFTLRSQLERAPGTRIEIRSFGALTKIPDSLDLGGIDLVVLDESQESPEIVQLLGGPTRTDHGRAVLVVRRKASREVPLRPGRETDDVVLHQELETPLFLRMVAIALSKAELRRQLGVQREALLRLAGRDDLTGLANRRVFRERLAIELERSRRHGSQLALVSLDLDRFKVVNDRFGHLVGDAVLSRVGRLLGETTRRTDLAARLGGDEFSVLMVEAALPGATLFAERLRNGMRASADTFESNALQISCSIGIATFKPTMHTPDELRECADQALYRAKALGGDVVIPWTEG